MFTNISNCPNPACQNHTGTPSKFFIKKGYFVTKFNHQKVPRYQCKTCGRFFSSNSIKPTFRQKKSDLNDMIFKLYASGTTQRRLATVLGINKKTVVKKILFLAQEARKRHELMLQSGAIKTSHIQFDEMETFEHSKLKPLSIAIAVRAKTGEIIDAKVSQMPAKGPTAPLSKKIYGPIKDERPIGRNEVLYKVGICAKPNTILITDGKPDYPKYCKKIIPEIIHKPIPNRLKTTKNRESLFTLNYTAAKIRNDLSRMARKTWVTTKKKERLQAHLDLYIAYNNGYKIT